MLLMCCVGVTEMTVSSEHEEALGLFPKEYDTTAVCVAFTLYLVIISNL